MSNGQKVRGLLRTALGSNMAKAILIATLTFAYIICPSVATRTAADTMFTTLTRHAQARSHSTHLRAGDKDLERPVNPSLLHGSSNAQQTLVSEGHQASRAPGPETSSRTKGELPTPPEHGPDRWPFHPRPGSHFSEHGTRRSRDEETVAPGVLPVSAPGDAQNNPVMTDAKGGQTSRPLARLSQPSALSGNVPERLALVPATGVRGYRRGDQVWDPTTLPGGLRVEYHQRNIDYAAGIPDSASIREEYPYSKSVRYPHVKNVDIHSMDNNIRESVPFRIKEEVAVSDISGVFTVRERSKRQTSDSNSTSGASQSLNDTVPQGHSVSGPDSSNVSSIGQGPSTERKASIAASPYKTPEDAFTSDSMLLVDLASTVGDLDSLAGEDGPKAKGGNTTGHQTDSLRRPDEEPVYNSSALVQPETNKSAIDKQVENSASVLPILENGTANDSRPVDSHTDQNGTPLGTSDKDIDSSHSVGGFEPGVSVNGNSTTSGTEEDLGEANSDTTDPPLEKLDSTSAKMSTVKSDSADKSNHVTSPTQPVDNTETSTTAAPGEISEAQVGAVLSSLVSNATSQPDSPASAPSTSPDMRGPSSDNVSAEGSRTGDSPGNITSQPEPSAEPEISPEPEHEPGVAHDGEYGDSSQPQPETGSTEESKGEPESEPNGEPGGEPEGEPTGEPEGEPEDDSPFPLPEPGPQWEEAKQKWGIAWLVHVYGLGGAFGLVGLYTLLSLVRLWRIPRLLSRGYFLSLNILMLGLCGTRAFYLLYDSYNSGGTFMTSLDYFLYSFAFPCLSAAFSVLLYALLKATNMQLVSPSVQRLPVLLFIIVVHFGLSLASDLLVGHFAGARIVLFVCQMYYILWGLFLFAGYAYIFRKLYSHAVKRQKNVIYSTGSSSTFPGGSNGSLTPGKVRSRYTLSTAVKVTFFTALCGLMTVGLELYAVAGVYNTFTWERPEPWPWYMYHSVLRVLELAMCVTMSYVASQPFRYRRSTRACCTCGVLCVPCCEILCCGSRNSYNVNDPRHQATSAGSCSYSDLDLAPTKLHSTRLRTPGDRDQLQTYSSPGTRKRPVISPPGPPQPSLLIVQDGYVRFQTEHDINRMVDSSAGRGQHDLNSPGPCHDIHSSNTLPLRDGWFNSGYARHGDESRARDALDKTDYCGAGGFPWDKDGDKSRKSSLGGSEFFRAPSSVSLAGSIENELEKAFVTFRQDNNTSQEVLAQEEQEKRERSEMPVEDHLLDITAVSELPNMKETDLISVDSQDSGSGQLQQDGPLPEPEPDYDLHLEPPAPSSPRETFTSAPFLSPEDLSHSPHPHSPRRPLTLLRRAKSSEMDAGSVAQPAWSQALRRSLSDHSTTRRPPLKSESSSVRYTHLLDMDSTDSKLSDTGHSDDVFSRRKPPQSSQGGDTVGEPSTMKSLLNSSTTNDNIDV